MPILSLGKYYEIITYILFLIVVVGVNTFLLLRTKRLLLIDYFYRTEALVGLWMLANVFRNIAIDQDLIWFWIIVEYFGICYFGAHLVFFSYIYKHNRMIHRKWQGLLLGISTVFFVLMFSNPYHQLFFMKMNLGETVKGPIFYFHMSFTYLLVVISIFFLVSSRINRFYSSKDKYFVAIGLIFPAIVNVIYLFEIYPIPFDLTPITFFIMMISFAMIAFQNNYYDMQEVTRAKILNNLFEGVIILDNENRIIEFNKKMSELTKPDIRLKKYTHFEKVIGIYAKYIQNYNEIRRLFIEFLRSENKNIETEIEVVRGDVKNVYIVKFQKSFRLKGEYSGCIIKFIDISEYKRLLYELEEKNNSLEAINRMLSENISVRKRLVIEEERNRISKELHDILGHSLTLVISLLEISKQLQSQNLEVAKEKLSQAMEVTRKSLKDLKTSIVLKKELNMDTMKLIADLQQLIDEFKLSGVEVEFIYNHYPIDIESEYYDAVYRICQESMTNSLRHGKAGRITIAVRFMQNSIDIVIADNGSGCNEFVKGNGILGMEQRVASLDGFFSCGSPDGEGFNLHANIPIQRINRSLNI